MLASLGFSAITKAGWWVVGIAIAMLVAVIGTQAAFIHSMQKDIATAGNNNGVLNAAKVACEGTSKLQSASIEDLTKALTKANAEIDDLKALGLQREQDARDRMGKVQADANQHKRDADALAKELLHRAELVKPGEPECVAAVRVIREHLK